jgi:hypothetical protein
MMVFEQKHIDSVSYRVNTRIEDRITNVYLL